MKEKAKKTTNRTTNQKKKMQKEALPKIIGMTILIIILSIIFIVSLICALNYRQVYNASYNGQNNVNYKVYLKDNEYYDNEYLDEGMNYIANIIDYIDIDFNYKFNASKNSNLKYKYSVTGKLLITEKGYQDQVLYEKQDILLEEKTITKDNAKDINITKNIKIDYPKYNALVSSFKSKYILSIDSNLLVTLHVEVSGTNENIQKKMSDTQDIQVIIPLSEQTIKIDTNYNKNTNNKLITEYKSAKTINIICFIISLISFILLIIIATKLVKLMNQITIKKSLYMKKMNKYLKEYDQIIVILNNMPEIDNLNMMEVSSFEELLDARENLDKPILFIETTKNKTSWFMIVDGNEVYRYILDSSTLNNGTKK